MATTTAISSQTAAATSADITVASGSSIQVWTSPRLGSNESVAIFRTDGGSPEVVERVYDGGDDPVDLADGVRALMLSGPGIFRLVKTVTTTATAVYYDS